MAYCPVPDAVALTTRDPSPATLTVNPPAATGAVCDTSITSTTSTGGSTPISTTTTTGGPPGPPGPAGGGTIKLQYNGTVVGTVDTLNFTSPGEAITATLSGATGVIGNDAVRWMGEWAAGTAYQENDAVLYNPDLPAAKTGFLGLSYNAPVPLPGTGNAYICVTAHTATDDDTPTGHPQQSANWDPMTQQGTLTAPSSPTLLDSLGGLFGWTKNLSPLGWLAVGAGVVAAVALGSKLVSAMSKTGSSSSTNAAAGVTANSTFTGTPTYTGAYTPPSIQQVVGSLCGQIWPSGTYDVSLLSTTQPCSISLQQVSSIRSIIDTLSQVFLFDVVDSSGIIKFVPRNRAPSFSFTHDDMGYNSKGDSVPPVTFKRMQSNDLPRSVSLSYLAQDIDYNTYTQISYIPNFDDGQDVTLDVPLVLDHALAKQLTEQILINAHLERQTYTFRTSYANAITIEPGDIGTIPEGNVRVMTMTEVSEGIIEFVCCDAGYTGAATPIVVGGVTIGYTAATYATTGQPVQLPATPVNTAPVVGFTDAFWVDPPALNSLDTTPRFFAAINSYGLAGWPGAQIFKSIDNGASYTLVGTTNKASTFGVVTSTLPNASPYVFDDVTTFNVTLKYGTLSSVTDTALLAGDNLCMVGKEVIAFGNATLNSDGSYTLSHLLRGRYGTEYAIGTHSASTAYPEMFTLLDDNLYKIELADGDVGKPFMYKIVTIGSDVSKVVGEVVAETCMNTIPWTVAQPGIIHNSDGSFDFSWLERPRFVNSLIDFADDPHDYDFGGYCVAISSTGTTKTGSISFLGPVTGGSLYVDGIYTNVPLTGGTGNGATADFVVTGGLITHFDLLTAGTGYTVGDVLSVNNSSLGGSGSGFSIAVTAVIVRTTFVTTTVFSYTNAMQIEDFGSAQSHVVAKVYQVSNKYGGGQPVTISI